METLTEPKSVHYKKGKYRGNKPYRDSLVAALRHFDMMSFVDSEFFTLGGMEWVEFEYLLDQGIVFGPRSYHNIDRGLLNQYDDPRVVAHPKTDFLDIRSFWKCPRAICYDSTEKLVKLNEYCWLRLIRLAIDAALLSGRVCFTWNYMTGYGNLPILFEEWHPLYEQWLGMLVERVDAESGLSVDFYNEGVRSPQEGSLTPMLCSHCLIYK